MNVCVCEPEAVGQGDTFPALAAYLAAIISQGLLQECACCQESLFH